MLDLIELRGIRVEEIVEMVKCISRNKAGVLYIHLSIARTTIRQLVEGTA